MAFSRALKFELPLMRGHDVLEAQLRLKELQMHGIGQPDGLFGARTVAAVREFQASRSLAPDGVIDARLWAELFQDGSAASLLQQPASNAPGLVIGSDLLAAITTSHSYRNGVAWQLTPDGILIAGDAAPLGTGGEPKTVASIWEKFGTSIDHWSSEFAVPAELIVATICTETSGKPDAIRREPGFVSETATPDKISPGLMQTLISTARGVLHENSINQAWLLSPDNSIKAGTAVIASQKKQTLFDPPKVACAYNAGGIYLNDSPNNRWKMRQYPIGTSEHADRFVKWFNDCFRHFAKLDKVPSSSFFRQLHKPSP